MGVEYTEFGRLLDLRKQKNKTIAEMAKDTGISASAISNYERGIRKPDADTLIALAKYFDCSTDYLLGLAEFQSTTALENSNELASAFIKLRGKDAESDLKVLVGIYGSDENFPEPCFSLTAAQMNLSLVQLELLKGLSVDHQTDIYSIIEKFIREINASQDDAIKANTIFYDSCRLKGITTAIKNAPEELQTPLAKLVRAAYPDLGTKGT